MPRVDTVDQHQIPPEEERRSALQAGPPSVKLVAKVLSYEGPLSQQAIAEESLLPTRTVRYAVARLTEQGVVESRFSFTDARKRVYRLTIDL